MGWSSQAEIASRVIVIGSDGVIDIDPELQAELFYAPTQAFGNLLMSLALMAGTDSFGNSFPEGLRVRGTGGAIDINPALEAELFYAPSPGLHNLLMSLALMAGTDSYGNAYPEGIRVRGAGGAIDINPALEAQLFYQPSPGAGNLIMSFALAAGTDSFGNAYPEGIRVNGAGNGVIDINPALGAVLFYNPNPGAGKLVMSLALAAGTDSYGNTFPAGLRVATSPQTMPAMTNGWSVGGHATYLLDPLGNLVVSWKDLVPGTDTDGTVIWASGSLPAGYTPSNDRRIACYTDQARINSVSNYAEGAALNINVDGSVTCFGIAAGATRADLFAVIPLTY